jgi:predicted nucleic acid-binding protein
MVCIDASVFVAFGRPSEPDHEASVEFLGQVDEIEGGIVDPVLVEIECAGALARRTDNVDRALHFASRLKRLPGMNLLEVDRELSWRSAQIAARHRLRGAYSVYVATAESHDATLVTWDQEMLDRGAAVVDTQTPKQWTEGNANAAPE